MEPIWHQMWLNPEPWAIGSVTPRRGGNRISPNVNLVTYQEAVKEALADVEMLPPDYRKITFYFWRQQAQYIGMDDRVRSRNQADSTNMQKALEDALQGVLFENDREVRDIRSMIVEQGYDVTPCIWIKAEIFKPQNWMTEFPLEYIEQILKGPVVKKSDNIWRGPNG